MAYNLFLNNNILITFTLTRIFLKGHTIILLIEVFSYSTKCSYPSAHIQVRKNIS